MIEEPPILKVISKQNRKRPSAALLARFEGAETGHLCDAMDGRGALDAVIKPLGATPPRLLGPALTLDCGPADMLAFWGGLADCEPGDVLMLATGMHRGCASMGDQTCAMAKTAGVAGIVTDGMARDIAGIEAVGLPVFAQGLSPNSPYSNGPGRVGYPMMMAGRQVATGDIVVGDRDGVVVVPLEIAEAVADALDGVREAEKTLSAKVADGLTCPPAFVELLAGPRTKFE